MPATTSSSFGALVALLFVTSIIAHTIDDMKKLIEDKKQYNKNFRPVYNQSETLSIYVNFDLISIQEFNEVSEKFSVVGFLGMGWVDQLIAWKPEDYGNMTEFAAEGAYFWKPNLVLVNPHGEVKAASNDWNVYRYLANGVAGVSPGDVFDAGCSVNITHYPWDEQECRLLFTPMGYTVQEVDIVSIRETIGTSFFIGNGMWDLIGSSATASSDGVTIITFTIRLRRKPRFVLVNVILPIVFMSFLNMIVFLIPTESGERISYCLTVLLAIAVFLTLIGDNLPKTSTPMSLLSYYLIGILAMSMGTVFATVFSLRIYFRDEKNPVPSCLLSLVRCLSCKCKKAPGLSVKYRSRKDRRARSDPESDDIPRHHNGRDSGVVDGNGLPVAHRHHGNWKNDSGVESCYNDSGRYPHEEDSSEKRSSTTESWEEEDDQVSWKDVSCAMDMLFFCFFLCSLIAVTTVFFVLTINKVDV